MRFSNVFKTEVIGKEHEPTFDSSKTTRYSLECHGFDTGAKDSLNGDSLNQTQPSKERYVYHPQQSLVSHSRSAIVSPSAIAPTPLQTSFPVPAHHPASPPLPNHEQPYQPLPLSLQLLADQPETGARVCASFLSGSDALLLLPRRGCRRCLESSGRRRAMRDWQACGFFDVGCGWLWRLPSGG